MTVGPVLGKSDLPLARISMGGMILPSILSLMMLKVKPAFSASIS